VLEILADLLAFKEQIQHILYVRLCVLYSLSELFNLLYSAVWKFSIQSILEKLKLVSDKTKRNLLDDENIRKPYVRKNLRKLLQEARGSYS
jgi:hypothetical protein